MPITLTDDQWERIADAVDTLDNLQTSLTVMTTIPPSIHVNALRSQMPDAVRIARDVIAEVDGDL